MLKTIEKFNLVPTTLAEAMQFAEIIAKSDMIPVAYKGKPANIMVAMQMGMSVGLAPLQALQNICIINGRPAMYGDVLLALVRASGLLESITETQINGVAVCVVKRVNEPELKHTFSMADANRAGLVKRNALYTTYPDRMIQMRARAFALRDAFPDVLMGLSSAEEMQDMAAIEAPEEIKATSHVELLKQKLRDDDLRLAHDFLEPQTVSIPAVETVEIPFYEPPQEELKEAIPDAKSRLIKSKKLEDLIKQSEVIKKAIDKWLVKKGLATIYDIGDEDLGKLIAHYGKE